ncbi:hypothetical protein [Herbidospora cretacea]|uniref:hypothetical protein n=1 Tax=Herbidospora cretacea TaxID=28444 RepID=UPI0004C3C48B|nr:hypothetical protein [Herbidospora cretacea]
MRTDRIEDVILGVAVPLRAVSDAHQAITLLRLELRTVHDLMGDCHVGDGVALLSVCYGLVVWTNGDWFRWQSGRTSAIGRPVYAFSPAADYVTAARRVTLRYGQLRQDPPQS